MTKYVPPAAEPINDESLLGYLSRLMSHTVFQSLSRVFVASGLSDDGRSAASLLESRLLAGRLAEFVGCKPEVFQSRVYSVSRSPYSNAKTFEFFGEPVRHSHFVGKVQRRVSPRALDVARYHRAMWDILPIGFDARTRETLLAECPVCKSPLGWKRFVEAFQCDKCFNHRGLPSTDLRDFPQPLIKVEDEAALDFVTDLMDPDGDRRHRARKSLMDVWSDHSNADIFEAVVALGSALHPPKGSGRRGDRGSRSRESVDPGYLTLAGRFVMGGQKEFDALADRIRRVSELRTANFYGARRELGPLAYVHTDRHLHPDVQKTLAAAIKQNMNAAMLVPSSSEWRADNQAFLPIAQLSRISGTSVATLTRLAKSGFVRIASSTTAKRAPICMQVSEIRPLLMMQNKFFGEAAAASYLGLPVSVLVELAKIRLLIPLEGACRGLVPGYAGYTQQSVIDFEEFLLARAKVRLDGATIPLSTVVENGSPLRLAALLLAAFQGGVDVFKSDAESKFSQKLLVDPSSTLVRDSMRAGDAPYGSDGPYNDPHNTMDNVEAAEALGVTEAFIGRLSLVRGDLLRFRPAGRKPYRRSEVEQISARFIFVSEISKRMMLTPRAARGVLLKNGIDYEFSLASKSNKDLVYLRAKTEAAVVDRERLLRGIIDDPAQLATDKLVELVRLGTPVTLAAAALDMNYDAAQRHLMRERVERHPTLDPVRRPPSGFDAHEDFVRDLMAKNPKISATEIRDALAKRGLDRTRQAVCNFLHRTGLRESRSSQTITEHNQPTC